MNKYLLTLLVLGLSTTSNAKEKKVQHDAHEHGVAEMNIVWEKEELNIELLSPAYNITGFEHQPSNHEQEEHVEKIEKHLNSPDELLAFNGASCKAEDIDIESPFEDHHKHDDHKTKDEHDDHKHDSHDKHADHKDHDSHDKHEDHDDHKEHDSHDEHVKHDDHKEHDEHEHDKQASTHSEYSMSYTFHCHDTKSELKIDMAELFKHLPQMEKIKVQWLSASSQSSSILTKKSSTLTLK